MKYVYPALFSTDQSENINVKVPDLAGCVTFGRNPYDAIVMARDAMSMWLCDAEDKKEAVPPPSTAEEVKADGCSVALVDVDTDEYRRLNDNRAVKKTLTIPSWLNAKAERAGVNFSQVLQDALKERLGGSQK